MADFHAALLGRGHVVGTRAHLVTLILILILLNGHLITRTPQAPSLGILQEPVFISTFLYLDEILRHLLHI